MNSSFHGNQILGIYGEYIVEQKVPLTFQMGTFLNKMECFKYFYSILHKTLVLEVFVTNYPKIAHISLNNTFKA